MGKDVAHIYNGILLSHKKNYAICSNMDRLRDDHPKWSESEREKQIPYDTTYMWNLKDDTNELVYKTESTHRHTQNRFVVSKGRGWGGGVDFGISRCKPLYRMDKQQDPTV